MRKNVILIFVILAVRHYPDLCFFVIVIMIILSIVLQYIVRCS